MSVRIAIVVALLIVLALGACAPQPPTVASHENPDTAPRVFDRVLLLGKYSEALDYVLSREANGVAMLQDQSSWANIPAELSDTVNRFLSSGQSLAGSIQRIEADLRSARTMLAQFRPGEAKQSSAAAAEKVTQAYSELRAMERGAENTGRWWGAESAGEGSPLRQAYEEVLVRLEALKALLTQAQGAATPEMLVRLEALKALLTQAQGAATPEVLARLEELKALLTQAAATPEVLARLEELKALLTQGAATPEVLTRLLRLRSLLDRLSEMRHSLTQQAEELKGGLLRPTTLTLSVHPTVASVGDPVEFSSTLAAQGEPLPGRSVTILLDGSPASVVLTDSGGAYQGQMVLPYQFVPEMTIQALYYPQGADLGRFPGSSSPEVAIKVLFYPTQLSLQTPTNGYPGRTLVLKGKFHYAGNPVAESRSLSLYWDGELAVEQTVGVAFTLELPVAAEASLGKHRVALYVSPQKRYAPTWASADVEVIKATPVIELDTPRMVLLPFALNLRGKAYSTLGPLQEASLRIALGDQEVSTWSREDGSFGAHLRTRMGLTLVGAEQLRVSVIPKEPWHKASSVSVGLLVINPANIAGLALALAIPAIFGAYRVRRRAVPRAAPPYPQPAPALVRREIPRPQAGTTKPEVRGSSQTILLTLYRGVLRLVQRLTAVVLRPSHTLREFAQECAPRLGPLTSYFQEFTLMIERLLYSRHRAGEAEAARGRELRQKIEEGVKGEDT